MLDFNIGIENFANSEQNIWFLCAVGIVTVFIGLICLVIVCKLMTLFKGETKEEEPTYEAIVPAATAEQPIENKQELIAAVSAAVAEELGTDVSGIRITSFKKL